MYFYAVEATLSNPFDDPVGLAESGWAATPNLALCEIETAPTRSMVFLASDVGYRTRATDPGGVVAYPPSVVEAFKVDVEANLDPTKSAVAAAFGNLTLNNLDGSLDFDRQQLEQRRTAHPRAARDRRPSMQRAASCLIRPMPRWCRCSAA